jgi:SAM-dependent methyltransferase
VGSFRYRAGSLARLPGRAVGETRRVIPDEPTDADGAPTPHDYGASFADVYDDWYADVSDVDATVARIVELVDRSGGGRVLELGAGSGRIALPLAAQGLEVTGIDISETMLDLLRAKEGSDHLDVRVGDMALADTVVDGRFVVVLVAFNTFFNLDTEQQQRRCMEGVAMLLSPGGSFVIEAFVPADPPAQVERDLSTSRVEPDRLVLAATEHDPARQTITGQHVDITATGIRLRPWRIRYATPVQLDEMAAAAGLTLAERHAGWRSEPVTPQTTSAVSRYVRSPDTP